MADFKKSYAKTAKFEGGYANNPNDNGGETYKGIARKAHPTWSGWRIIDTYKKSEHSNKQLNEVLKGNQQLDALVEQFYLEKFWNQIMGTSISNQWVADNIFDFAVNSGINRAVRYAQRIVGATEDGVMGSQTIKAINKNVETFVAKYKKARTDFINKGVSNGVIHASFQKGLLSRVENA